MSTSRKFAAVLLVSGLALLSAGAFAINAGLDGRHQVTAQLSQEHVTVSADAPDKAYAGKPLDSGPAAKAESGAIFAHMMKASGGKTYSEVPSKAPAATPATVALRATLATGESLRTALLSASLAWEVAKLVIVLGVGAALVGLVLTGSAIKVYRRA